MSIEQLLRPIKVGLKSQWFVCLATILAAYLSYITPNPFVRLMFLIILLFSAEVMIIVCGNFFLSNFFESLTQRRHISWNDVRMSENLRKLASERGIKLNKKSPFGIRRDFRNAYANPWTKQIVIGDALLKELSSNELLALLGHELTHLEHNHGPNMVLWTFYIAMIAALPLNFLRAPSVVVNVVYFAALFLAFSLISRRYERLADAGAAAMASPEAVVSMLKRLVPRDQWRRESETHPSILRRILFLRKRSRSSESKAKSYTY